MRAYCALFAVNHDVISGSFGTPLVVVIESAFWRPAPGSAPGLKLRLRATLVEALARWSVRRAALLD